MNIGYKELAQMGVALKPPTIRRRVRMGTFPKPVRGGRGGEGRFEWDKAEVMAWLKGKPPARR